MKHSTLQRGARRVARVVLGAQAFHASRDVPAAVPAVVAPEMPEGMEAPDGPRGDMAAAGDADTVLLVGRSLRADKGAAFCLGLAAWGTGGLPPSRARAL
jgi:hypothetical protein